MDRKPWKTKEKPFQQNCFYVLQNDRFPKFSGLRPGALKRTPIVGPPPECLSGGASSLEEEDKERTVHTQPHDCPTRPHDARHHEEVTMEEELRRRNSMIQMIWQRCWTEQINGIRKWRNMRKP